MKAGKNKYTEGMFGDRRTRRIFSDVDGKLRQPQEEAFDALMLGLERGKNGLLAAPTAFGKSKLAGVIMDHFRNWKLCIVATPKLGILRSFKETLRTWIFGRHGRLEKYSFMEVLGGGTGKRKELANIIRCYSGDRENVVLVSHATLTRMLDELKDEPEQLRKCFVVVDEAHHVGHFNGEGREESNRLARMMGLMYEHKVQHLIMTATDYRNDGRELVPPERMDEYVVFKMSLSELRSGYSEAFVPDVRISLRSYSRESVGTLSRMERESTELKPVVADFDALKRGYREEYEANPVPTLMQVPYAVIGGGVSNCEMALELEDFLRAKNPRIRILNLGGTRRTGRPSLVSTLSPKQARAEYDKLDSEQHDWDVVISIAVMDEGMDWTPCSRVFLPRVTSNARLFMQRDVGRGVRMHTDRLTGRKKETLEVVYFCSGLVAQGEKDDEEVLGYWRRSLVYFSLLFLGESVYGRFDAFPESVRRLCRPGKKDEAVSRQVLETVIQDYYSEKSRKEEAGGRWDEEDVGEFLMGHELLAEASDEERMRLLQKLCKMDNRTFLEVLKDCSSKMMSGSFEDFWRKLPDSLRKFEVEVCLDERGKVLTRMLLPTGVSGKRLRRYWRRWREEFDGWEEQMSMLDEFKRRHGRLPSEESKDKDERRLAKWVEIQRRNYGIKKAFRSMRSSGSGNG